ncbi:hypothetical protein [Muricoccus aerilatus]|uniref:hypothetical protein n=1 Tax=Muricoccus aerilatus TaxID=452982 RepID=UPI0005C1967D|nr:hypothetical protein [Roseomonas aerilata]
MTRLNHPFRHSLGRRAALALGTGALVRPGPAEAAPAVPCPAAPGEIVGLVLEGTGAPSGTVTVFGQAFQPGHVPHGAVLRARDANGREIPAQLDVIAAHPDGSARLAVVSLAPPAIAKGQEREVMLMSATGSPAEPLNIAAGRWGRSAVLELAAAAGQVWRLDLLSAFRSAPADQAWQSGPLAVQRRVSVDVPASSLAGVTSLRVVADVSVRSDGTIWTDVWLRNDAAMRPGGGAVSYGVRVLLDGREAMRTGLLHQWHYTGWGRLLAADHGKPAAEPPRPRHDTNYLADAGAVPRYRMSGGTVDRALGRLAQQVGEGNWSAPLEARGITRAMPSTGGRADIGPVTEPQALWLGTGDQRAATVSIGQAEAAGSVPWHMWDPSVNGWLDVKKWPRLWVDGRGGPPPGGLMQNVSSDTGWTPDTAHQPDLSTVPLVLTGRRAFLDELLAQSAWNIISLWPAPRGEGEANIVRGVQVRGAAWSMRQLDNAAWAAPRGDRTGDYLRGVAASNWAWIRAQIPEWTRRQGEAHGWIPGEYGTSGALPPWQQDYFVSTAALSARRGNADARAVLDWMENFIAGRFLSGDRGFNPHDGCAYNLAIAPEGQPQSPFSTWARIGQETRARNLSNGNGWANSEGVYGILAIQSLTLLSELTGTPRVRAALSWIQNAGAPYTAPAQRAAQFDIAPKEATGGCQRRM